MRDLEVLDDSTLSKKVTTSEERIFDWHDREGWRVLLLAVGVRLYVEVKRWRRSSEGTMGSRPCAVTTQLITLRCLRRVVDGVVTGDGGAVKADTLVYWECGFRYTTEETEECVDDEVVVEVRWEVMVEYGRFHGGVIVGMRLFCRYGFDWRWDGQCDDGNK